MLEFAVFSTTCPFGVLFPIADNADVVVLQDADCACGHAGISAQGFAVGGLMSTRPMQDAWHKDIVGRRRVCRGRSLLVVVIPTFVLAGCGSFGVYQPVPDVVPVEVNEIELIQLEAVVESGFNIAGGGGPAAQNIIGPVLE